MLSRTQFFLIIALLPITALADPVQVLEDAFIQRNNAFIVKAQELINKNPNNNNELNIRYIQGQAGLATFEGALVITYKNAWESISKPDSDDIRKAIEECFAAYNAKKIFRLGEIITTRETYLSEVIEALTPFNESPD